MKKGFFQKKTTTAPLQAARSDCIFIENSPILAYHFGNGETAPQQYCRFAAMPDQMTPNQNPELFVCYRIDAMLQHGRDCVQEL